MRYFFYILLFCLICFGLAEVNQNLKVVGTISNTDTTNIYKIGASISSASASLNATTYYQTLTGLSTTEGRNVTVTDSTITIPKAGFYSITFTSSNESSGTNIVIEGALFENDIENTDNIEFRIGTGTGTDVAKVRMMLLSCNFHYLAGGTVLKIKIKINSGTSTLTFTKPHLSITRLP